MCEIDQSKSKTELQMFRILDVCAFDSCLVSSDGQKLTKKLLMKGLTNILNWTTFPFLHFAY